MRSAQIPSIKKKFNIFNEKPKQNNTHMYSPLYDSLSRQNRLQGASKSPEFSNKVVMLNDRSY